MPLKDTGVREREQAGKPSDHDASLTPWKGTGKEAGAGRKRLGLKCSSGNFAAKREPQLARRRPCASSAHSGFSPAARSTQSGSIGSLSSPTHQPPGCRLSKIPACPRLPAAVLHLFKVLRMRSHRHFSWVRLQATLWTVAHQAPLSMGFSRQENLNGLPCPPPGHPPNPGIKPSPSALTGKFFTTSAIWEAASRYSAVRFKMLWFCICFFVFLFFLLVGG